MGGLYTDYIKQGMLEQHNVEVEFVSIGRLTEADDMNTALASGDAPDVCVTYSYPTIAKYPQMGGIVNLNDTGGKKLEEYKDILPNLWDLLGDNNIYYDQDPESGNLWAVEARLADNARINTFIRKDWLDKLEQPLPTTEEEFYNYKEGVRVLNKWYNEGLVWKDFAEYASDSAHEDDMMKAGFVGAFQHNWDYPYRGGYDSIQANLQRNVGEDAAYIAVDTFVNDAGVHRKFLAQPIDRKVFFPATNDEPIASLLYLNFISDPETIAFLQLGKEGESYNAVEGGFEKLATTGDWLRGGLF